MATLITGSGVDKVIDGSIVDADIVGVSSSKLTGALPAVDGSALTGVAPTKATIDALGIAASSITGALPVIDGSNLTGVSGGKVLQFKHNVLASLGGFSTTSTTLQDTGLSISITPTSSSNTMVIVNLGGLAYRNGSYPNGKVQIHSSLNGGSLCEVARYHFGENNTVTAFYGAGVSTSVEESLGAWTSGAITYKVQIASGTGANYAYSNWGKASLYVMEIEA